MLVAIEGIDASGKTTLAQKFKLLGFRCHKFPDYGTATGKVILKLLQSQEPLPDKALVLQALMTCNKIEVIADLMQNTQPLVLDRYITSAIAYGNADNLETEMLEKFHSFLPRPDLNILLHLSAEDSFRRRPIRTDHYESDWNRLEDASILYQEFFEHQREQDADSWLILDARQSPDEIWDQTCRAVIRSAVRILAKNKDTSEKLQQLLNESLLAEKERAAQLSLFEGKFK